VIAMLFSLFPHNVKGEGVGYFALLSTETVRANHDPSVIYNLNNFVKNELMVNSNSLYTAKKAIDFDFELVIEGLTESSHKSATIFIVGPAKNTAEGCKLVLGRDEYPLKNFLTSLSKISTKDISIYLDFRMVDDLSCRASLNNLRFNLSNNLKIYFSESGKNIIEDILSDNSEISGIGFSDLTHSFIASHINLSKMSLLDMDLDYKTNKRIFTKRFLVFGNPKYSQSAQLVNPNDSTIVNQNFEFFSSAVVSYAEKIFESAKKAIAKAAREKAAREKAAREKAAREKSAIEKAAREKAAREKFAREKAGREKSAREKAAIEKAKKEKEARELIKREKQLAAQLKIIKKEKAKLANKKAAADKEKDAKEKDSVNENLPTFSF
jgi:hypothetical protein